jgi:hypothetical protein
LTSPGFSIINSLLKPLRKRRLLSRNQIFRNVVVVPYENLLTRQRGGHDHEGGPIWPDWGGQTYARFNRNGIPWDRRPVAEPPTDFYSGRRYVWGGPLHPHFGHGVSELLTRLACASRRFPDAFFVFASRKSHPVISIETAPDWFRGLLAWYQIPEGRVLIITSPVAFESLIAFPQQEQLEAEGPSEVYLDLLDELVATRLHEPGQHLMSEFGAGVLTYVSRAGMKTCFAGESYLERVLEQSEVNVFRPEKHDITDQMMVYCRSEKLIFPEGSALHGTQLLGRSLNDVSVLVRRAGQRFCEPFLLPRARNLEYVECSRGMIHGINLRGRPLLSGGMPLIDVDMLLPWFGESGVQLKDTWNQSDFKSAEKADVSRWLKFTSRQPHSQVSREKICETLVQLGFADLLSEAERLLG